MVKLTYERNPQCKGHHYPKEGEVIWHCINCGKGELKHPKFCKDILAHRQVALAKQQQQPQPPPLNDQVGSQPASAPGGALVYLMRVIEAWDYEHHRPQLDPFADDALEVINVIEEAREYIVETSNNELGEQRP